MLSVQTRGKILVLKFLGDLEKEHLAETDRLLESKLENKEDASVLLDLRRYDGASDLEGMWLELKLVTMHANKVKKIAVVGSLDWQRLITAIVSPFTRAKERFFEPGDIDEAVEWLRE